MKLYTICCFLFIVQFAHAQTDSLAEKVDDRLFQKVDVEADFIGGNKSWQKFLMKNLNANVPGDNGAPIGRYTVVAKFVISKSGTISDIAVETNNGYGMEEEVMRIIKKSGNWAPAIQNGKKVNAYRKQPITFAVEQDDIEFITKYPYVFTAGVDNELEIHISGKKSKDMEVTITGGIIKPIGNGKYIVNVSKIGRVNIEVFTGRKRKSYAAASFQVKAAGKELNFY